MIKTISLFNMHNKQESVEIQINDEKAWLTPFFVLFKMLIAIDITVKADCYYIHRLIYFTKPKEKSFPLASWQNE